MPSFHTGERTMHSLLKVPRDQNPTAPGLPGRYGMRVMQSSLLALGTLDAEGRPWTTVWGGERGFARPIAQGVLGINSQVDTTNDPVFKSLWGGKDGKDGAVVRPGNGEGKDMAALAIDLETRDRVKLAGKMLAGAVADGASAVQMAMVVTESLGNCPKYLNKKDIVPHAMQPELVAGGFPLTRDARSVIERADMFFLSSTDGKTMDTNHRGGSPGFVRVVRNEYDGLEIVYPEYSGNRLYQSLGNLKVNPLIGIAIPDFTNGDVLHLTGTATILIGEDASSLMGRTNLAVRISVSDTKFIKSGLPFRGNAIEYSPYNPPLRYLASEHHAVQPPSKSLRPDITASLVKREPLAETINRFTFRLESRERIPKWRAGQYVTLDFEEEVSGGYAHMNDGDPQSLNDDYVRTFTISSPPGRRTDELQITARRHGPVTAFLERVNVQAVLDIPVLGFGGEEAFHIPEDTTAPEPVFIAAGVGITPLLAQAPALLAAGVPLRLLWSLRVSDLALARDTFKRNPGLAALTTLFLTGDSDEGDGIAGLGSLVRRRIGKEDVKGLKGRGRKFFLCTAPALLKRLIEWLDGEEVVSEDFGY